MKLKSLFFNANKIFKNAKERGFFHIIISSSLVKIVSFISAMFLPRFLSKTDFGLLTYVDNIRGYILLINGLGISNATIRYCAQDDSDEQKKGYFIISLIVGILFDVILTIITIVGFILIPFPFRGSNNLLLLLSLIPLFTFILEDIQLLLRACFENKKYSALSFIYSTLMVVLQIVLAIVWKLNGVVLARYIAAGVSILLGYMIMKDISVIRSKAIIPNKENIMKMMKYGIVVLVGNATSLIMQLNEIFIMGQILKDKTALADYKVASYILSISLFLLQSVVIFIFPYFVKHKNDKAWVWKKFKKLFFINAMIMIPIHLILIIFSKQFILIIFGQRYLSAVPIMQMLLIASLGQAIFRGLTGNLLTGIGEEKYNLTINIIFTIIHVFIDIYAIKSFGTNGAAVALTIVYFVSGIVMLIHLRKVCINQKRKKKK